MVFPGRFSTGCQRCRQRKIKCDETRPSCRRCYLYGQPCPGYTDQFHFRTHSSNSSTEKTSAARQSRRQSDDPQKHDQIVAVVRTWQTPATIEPPLAISYDEVSLCYFVRRFVTPYEADSFPGHLSFLPGLYSHYEHGILELATLAVAQMAAFNQFGGHNFRLQSYQNYGRAIQVLRSSIQNEDDVTDDRVIAAVLLLCMFKDISGEDWGDSCDHASGLYYLLERRGLEQLCTSRGFELFLLALIKLQVYSFLKQDDSYGDPGGLVASLSLFDPMMRAMSLMTRSLSLRLSLLKSEIDLERLGRQHGAGCQPGDQRDNSSGESPTLMACFEALEEFDNWDSDAEAYWKNTFEGRSAPAALGEVAIKATFYDPETACTIILVRSARLVLLLSILEHCQRTQHANGTDKQVCNDPAAWNELVFFLEQNARLTIDDMLWCVPFAMGDLDSNGQTVSMPYDGAPALIILQPMRLVTYCPYATNQQKNCSQSILDRLNLGIGVRSAVSWNENTLTT